MNSSPFKSCIFSENAKTLYIIFLYTENATIYEEVTYAQQENSFNCWSDECGKHGVDTLGFQIISTQSARQGISPVLQLLYGNGIQAYDAETGPRYFRSRFGLNIGDANIKLNRQQLDARNSIRFWTISFNLDTHYDTVIMTIPFRRNMPTYWTNTLRGVREIIIQPEQLMSKEQRSGNSYAFRW